MQRTETYKIKLRKSRVGVTKRDKVRIKTIREQLGENYEE